MPTRRWVLAGSLAFAASAALADSGDFAPGADAGFDRWLAGFRKRAAAKDIPAPVLDRALSRAQFLPGVIAKDRSQFEFSLTFEDYLAITVSAARVRAGRQALASRGALLSRIERAYGVDEHVLAAIWGIESFYGTKRGEVPVISAMATLAYDGRRADFFEGQLIAALKIVAHGDVSADRMMGGWAGAMGHMQFIPTTYRAYAVDWTGDGRSDHWGDDPADALASAANYLKAAGWVQGRPSSVEVAVPQGMGKQLGKRRAVADWRALGVTLANGAKVPDHGSAKLMQPQKGGPAFLAWRNFDVLGHYNAAASYCLAVGVLADAISGGPGLAAGFPPDANGLTQADRVFVQQRLTALGFDTGSVDGVFGPKTTTAVKGFQAAHGLKATGVADAGLVAALR